MGELIQIVKFVILLTIEVKVEHNALVIQDIIILLM